ncbi:MAG: class II aldolase/adducin family protein [Lachnospiraceae bacterium]|nr:class II aldolase/adducin family protein [Lachnospiraceae bacterium]
MEEKELRQQITETGRRLLQDGLVARTWGNVSARVDAEHFLITPSGLDYMQTRDEDLALYHPADKTWSGPHKPSSEKGIHAAAYELFPEVNFVIHTHQTYASAIGVFGFDRLSLTKEEKESLGGIALAGYGLPGTGKLKKEVTAAFATGAHTVFMKHHGVVIAAASREEAYERALLLEEVCKRNCDIAEQIVPMPQGEKAALKDEILLDIQQTYPNARWVNTEAVLRWALLHRPLTAQLDDMAQMIGRRIPWVKAEKEAVRTVFSSGGNAAFVGELGAVVCGRDADDTEALQILVDKSAVCALNTMATPRKTSLGAFDSALMHLVYQKKYSKQKNG